MPFTYSNNRLHRRHKELTGGRRQLVIRVQSLIQGDVGRQLLSVPRLSSVQDYIRRAGLQSPSGISPSSSGWRSRGTWETETPRRSQHHVEVGPVISSSFLQLNLLLQGTASLLPKMWTTMSSIAEALGSSRRMMVSVSLWWQLNSNLASLLKIKWQTGLCGVCGDPFDQARPRDNEMGGRSD